MTEPTEMNKEREREGSTYRRTLGTNRKGAGGLPAADCIAGWWPCVFAGKPKRREEPR